MCMCNGAWVFLCTSMCMHVHVYMFVCTWACVRAHAHLCVHTRGLRRGLRCARARANTRNLRVPLLTLRPAPCEAAGAAPSQPWPEAGGPAQSPAGRCHRRWLPGKGRGGAVRLQVPAGAAPLHPALLCPNPSAAPSLRSPFLPCPDPWGGGCCSSGRHLGAGRAHPARGALAPASAQGTPGVPGLLSSPHPLPFPCSLQLQPARPAVPLQHGALQAVGAEERRRLPELPAQHCGAALPLLQGGLLPGPQQVHHGPQGLQR